jgi:hypothetical protein
LAGTQTTRPGRSGREKRENGDSETHMDVGLGMGEALVKPLKDK